MRHLTATSGRRVASSIVVYAILFSGEAQACKCFGASGPDASAAALVFKGRVLTEPRRVEAKEWDLGPVALSSDFEVEKAWKGNPGPVAQVVTGLTGGVCRVFFERGKSYLVLANRVGNSWATTTCNAVRSAEEEARLVSDLGPPKTEYVRVGVAVKADNAPVTAPAPAGDHFRWVIVAGILGLLVGYLFASAVLRRRLS